VESTASPAPAHSLELISLESLSAELSSGMPARVYVAKIQKDADTSTALPDMEALIAVEAVNIGVKIELTFDMHLSDITGNEHAFSHDVVQDTASSLGVLSTKVHVLQLQAGSILVTVGLAMDVCGEGGRSVMDVAHELVRQAFDNVSPLRDASARLHTAKVVAARVGFC